VIEHEDEKCTKYTKLYPKECCEFDGESEYVSQTYMVRRLLGTPKVDET